MTPGSRWIGGVFIIAATIAAVSALSPLFHRFEERLPSVERQEAPKLQASASPNSARPYAGVPASVAAPMEAQPPQDSRVEDWKKHFPSEVLPYNLISGGPKPGLPLQKVSGFSLSAQASDAPDALGHSALAADKTRQIVTYLTVETSQPIPKMISWELVENGLLVEGEPRGNYGISYAGLLPARPAELTAAIVRDFPSDKNKHSKYIIIRGDLRQAENYEEPLTFHTPAVGGGASETVQSHETPSGVTVTLSPQALTSVGGSSDPSILRLSFSVSPAQIPALLPNSPLYQKYHHPVLLRVGVTTPTGNTYDYPFSDLENTASLYKQPRQPWQYGPTPDVLTLVVQQRVYLQGVPFALKVPISHKPIMDRRVNRNP